VRLVLETNGEAALTQLLWAQERVLVKVMAAEAVVDILEEAVETAHLPCLAVAVGLDFYTLV
jgi:hypothetical protein